MCFIEEQAVAVPALTGGGKQDVLEADLARGRGTDLRAFYDLVLSAKTDGFLEAPAGAPS